MEEKLFENWEQLENSIRICKDCKLCQNRNKVVIGEGNKNARIMFIGEGPGADEDIQGRPFVGRAGKLMDQAFKGIGIKREEVYIANVVKCRPPGNRKSPATSATPFLSNSLCCAIRCFTLSTSELEMVTTDVTL